MGQLARPAPPPEEERKKREKRKRKKRKRKKRKKNNKNKQEITWKQVTRQNIFNGGSLAAHLAGARRVTMAGHLRVT